MLLAGCGVKSDLVTARRQADAARAQKDPSKPPQPIGAMNHFAYRDGVLHAEDVDLAALAEKVGTPFYCYSTATLERHYRVFADALPEDTLIAFSVKANGNLAVLKTLARLGAGADVVSGGELQEGAGAGIPAERIVFSGVGKTKAEMQLGLDAGIHQFNVESEPELEALNEVALALGKRAPITIRVNPDVDAQDPRQDHHRHGGNQIRHSRGARAREAYALAARLPGIEIVGIDVHIGSQITELGAVRGRVRARRRTGRSSCAPTVTRSRASISAAGWACPTHRQ